MNCENKVSVIMSCYNEKLEWIRYAIESILNQTYTNLEFIIIVDKPDDNEIIQLIKLYSEKDKRIKYFINKKNMGLVKSLNKAIQYSTGYYIARMDADDISDLYRLEKQIKYMKDNTEIDLIGCPIEVIDEYGISKGKRSLLPCNYEKIKDILPITNFYNHPTWFVKRKVYIELNGYREINRNEDYDFLLRALSKGYKLSNINEHLLLYRERANSISRSNPLEQYIATLYTKHLYKERIKNKEDSYSKESCEKFIQSICTHENNIKYKNAFIKFETGANQLKNGVKIRGILLLLESFISNKYQRQRISELIKSKLKRSKKCYEY